MKVKMADRGIYARLRQRLDELTVQHEMTVTELPVTAAEHREYVAYEQAHEGFVRTTNTGRPIFCGIPLIVTGGKPATDTPAADSHLGATDA